MAKETSQIFSIERLHDDCLLNIFENLPIKDRITIERGMFLNFLKFFTFIYPI